MKYLKIGLSVLIVVMAFILYRNIQKPIRFNEEKKIRYEKVIQRLKDIRTAQIAYKDLKGKFAGNFDSLLMVVKNEKFLIVKVIGNPDDTTQVIKRDTFYRPVQDSLFSAGYMVDSLPYVPFGSGEKFSINAGEMEKGKVNVQVFEVRASNEIILRGLDEKYIDKNGGLQVGSMSEPTYTGNWE